MKTLWLRFKHYLKEFYKLLIVFTIFFFVLTYQLPYSIYEPGGLINISDNLNVENKDKGSLNLTYVSSQSATIPTLLWAYLDPNWDIVKNSTFVGEEETLKETQKRDVIMLYESISNAIYVAYSANNIEPNIVHKKVYVKYIFPEANTDLEVGDIILAVDDIEMDNSIDVIKYINSKNVGDDVLIKVLSNGKEKMRKATLIDVEGTSYIGITLSNVFDYKDVVRYLYNSREAGPSGGLMISLAIYNALVDEDITHGLSISGTGTINLDGSVGAIGGVKYKLGGAVKKGADVFIVPTGENYEEAKKLVKKNNYDIKLIEAKTFNQVLAEIKNLK